LPRLFIERLTHPGQVVLDPMMGSGTTVLEAALLGRRAIGVDVDPLAVQLCRVKTTPLCAGKAGRSLQSAVARAAMRLMDPADLERAIGERFDGETRAFIDYWFLPTTQQELMALVLAIEEEFDPPVRDLLRVVLSSVIVTKSGGVSRARDLAHTRPHRVLSKIPRGAVEQFEARGRRALAAIGELPSDGLLVSLHHGDARSLPLADGSADLVITSPPYANAIDYMRAHKFSLVWLGEPVAKLSRLRAMYVGSENCPETLEDELPPGALAATAAVRARDRRKARILSKYLHDMKSVLAEILRVLRPGGAAGIVVGPSTMRGVRVMTHEHLAEIGQQLGFHLVGIAKRKLDRDRRMMPARDGKGSMNGIELRMHDEFVIGLVKP
jgi:DNA modification methylase